MNIKPLNMGTPWETPDPFLFCMYHHDSYPAGNDRLGPAASLSGHHIGSDFEGTGGWRMYHGQTVPGFPQHPHRGFETVTIMREGFIDHSDSLGATARYGPGDVQWLTAGRGIVHCEMFPLLRPDKPNALELFQIWLNLPRDGKLVEPHFSMFWDRDVPRVVQDGTEVRIVAGALGTAAAPPPPPDSWAARPEGRVAIWTIRMAPHSRWTLPPADAGAHRMIYFFRGSSVKLASESIQRHASVNVQGDHDVAFENGPDASEFLLLQGRPIGEPVVQYGPFVMNTRDEIQQAFRDYQRTGFGGWPWTSDEPVFARSEGRFARHADGKMERPEV